MTVIASRLGKPLHRLLFIWAPMISYPGGCSSSHSEGMSVVSVPAIVLPSFLVLYNRGWTSVKSSISKESRRGLGWLYYPAKTITVVTRGKCGKVKVYESRSM